MRQDYYETLLNKRAVEKWHGLSIPEQIKHTLSNSKEYRSYQFAIRYDSDLEIPEYRDHWLDYIEAESEADKY